MNHSIEKFLLTEEDFINIRQLGKVLNPGLDQILDAFYNDWMTNQPFYSTFFFNESVIEHVKGKQKEYWELFFNSKIDEIYIQSRKSIGIAHAQIGVSLEMYFQALSAFLDLFQKYVHKTSGIIPLSELPSVLWSLIKYINWDVSIIVDAYNSSANNMLEQMLTKKEKSIQELDAPLTTLWDDILLLTLSGELNAKRTEYIVSKILGIINETQTKVLVIDLNGVTGQTKNIAHQLIKITKAIQLMGSVPFLSGISGKLAESFVKLELDLSTIDTSHTLMKALQNAFALTGRVVNQIASN